MDLKVEPVFPSRFSNTSAANREFGCLRLISVHRSCQHGVSEWVSNIPCLILVYFSIAYIASPRPRVPHDVTAISRLDRRETRLRGSCVLCRRAAPD